MFEIFGLIGFFVKVKMNGKLINYDKYSYTQDAEDLVNYLEYERSVGHKEISPLEYNQTLKMISLLNDSYAQKLWSMTLSTELKERLTFFFFLMDCIK